MGKYDNLHSSFPCDIGEEELIICNGMVKHLGDKPFLLSNLCVKIPDNGNKFKYVTMFDNYSLIIKKIDMGIYFSIDGGRNYVPAVLFELNLSNLLDIVSEKINKWRRT